MRTLFIPGGWYCDALPDGRWASATFEKRNVQTSQGTQFIDQDLLFIVVGTRNGELKFAGQDQGGAGNYECMPPTRIGDSFGVNPIIYGVDGKPIQARESHQGFRYLDPNGRIFTGDETIFDGTFHEFSKAGDVTIGQYDDGTTIGCGLRVDGGPVRLIEPGDAFAIRVHRDGDRFSVAFWQKRPARSVFVWFNRNEVTQFPIVALPSPIPVPPPPTPKPVSMKLPSSVKSARDTFISTFPVPSKRIGESQDLFEDRMRAYVRKIAEYVVFRTGDFTIGVKDAGGGRPQSKDAIAQNGSPLIAWDLFTGTGTGHPELVDDPSSIDITGQHFISVTPVDHVGGTNTGGGLPPAPAPVEDHRLAQALDRIAKLEAALADCIKVTDSIAIRAVTGRYLTCEDGNSPATVGEFVGPKDNRRPKGSVIANRETANSWETFRIEKV